MSPGSRPSSTCAMIPRRMRNERRSLLCAPEGGFARGPRRGGVRERGGGWAARLLFVFFHPCYEHIAQLIDHEQRIREAVWCGLLSPCGQLPQRRACMPYPVTVPLYHAAAPTGSRGKSDETALWEPGLSCSRLLRFSRELRHAHGPVAHALHMRHGIYSYEYLLVVAMRCQPRYRCPALLHPSPSNKCADALRSVSDTETP